MDRLSTIVWRDNDEGEQDEIEVTFNYYAGTSATWMDPGDSEEFEVVSAINVHTDEKVELTQRERDDVAQGASSTLAEALCSGPFDDDDLMRPF